MLNVKKLIPLLFLVTFASAQNKSVLLYGTVVSDDMTVDLSSGSILIDYYTSGNSYFTTESVNKVGHYKRKLRDVLKIAVNTNYQDYYTEEIIIDVNGRDSIAVNLKLLPKEYIYTRQQAITDISNNEIQLITYDTLAYNLTKNFDAINKFGFNYTLITKPNDDDFQKNIDEYNNVISTYLNIQDSEWKQKLEIVKDSINNAAADIYGLEDKLNIKKISFPDLIYLPKGMQQRMVTFQHSYNAYYYKNLKDYTINHIIDVIVNDKDYNNFRYLPERISIEYKILLPILIGLITNNAEVGLQGYDGIMICRGIFTETTHIGISYSISDDDLYTVAGRANYLLKLLTKEDFGNVLSNPDQAWLSKLQNRWVYWAKQLDNNEIKK